MKINQRIVPFLSFKDNAEEAAEFYTAIFPDSKIVRKVRNPHSEELITVEFQLCGMNFVALNSGRDWKYSEALSLSISCDTQEQIDSLWKSLTQEGKAVACGWLADKYGVSWQVVPSILNHWMTSGNPLAIQRMFESLWQMTKLDIATLEKAFESEPSS